MCLYLGISYGDCNIRKYNQTWSWTEASFSAIANTYSATLVTRWLVSAIKTFGHVPCFSRDTKQPRKRE